MGVFGVCVSKFTDCEKEVMSISGLAGPRKCQSFSPRCIFVRGGRTHDWRSSKNKVNRAVVRYGGDGGG